MSLSKHSTYPFNPDYLNLVPDGYIVAYNASLLAALDAGDITEDEYAYAELIANDAFYGCIVERFHDQRGSVAQQKVNVGEPAHPLNGSAFIQDDPSSESYRQAELPFALQRLRSRIQCPFRKNGH